MSLADEQYTYSERYGHFGLIISLKYPFFFHGGPIASCTSESFGNPQQASGRVLSGYLTAFLGSFFSCLHILYVYIFKYFT